MSPLTRKQFLAILVFSSVMTFIDTSIQLYIEFKGDLGYVASQFEQIENSHLNSLVSSLWKLDEEQIAIQLGNAVSLRDIGYIEIRDDDGRATHRAGTPARGQRFQSRTYDMVYSSSTINRHIGTLYVEADLTGAYQRLFRRTLMIFTTQGIKTFFVSFFILFILHHMVTRHLITLAGYMRQVNIETFDAPLTLNRKSRPQGRRDELDEVVSTIDNLRNAINFYIDNQDRVEKELRSSERKFRTFAEQAIIGICIVRDGSMIFTNEGLSSIYGYTHDEFLTFEREGILRLFHHEDAPIAKDLYKANLSGIGDSVELRALTKTGREKWVQLFSKPVSTDEGLTIYCIIVDTTERRLYENEMTKFKVMTDKASYGASIVDPHGKIIYVNDCFCRMHGYTSDELLGRPMTLVYPREQAGRASRLKRLLLDKGHYAAEPVDHVTKDGRVFPTLMNENLIQDAQNRPLFSSATTIDITDMRQLEEQLKHSHKMEAIGTLAGGVAHDFNNILGIVLGNAEMALQWIPEASPAWMNLTEILTASNRAKGVVRQLLNFSRKSEEQEKEPSRIGPLVRESVNLLRASLPKTIEISYSEEEDLPAVMANPTHIHQIMINLCTNASHAMEKKGGVLRIELGRYTMNGKPEDGAPALPSGSYVRVRVQDSGDGIPRDVIDKVFVPYFTTKETGKGTGMGLSVVHGLVKNHGGDIVLESREGEGTLVTLYLPAMETPPPKEAAALPDLPRGTERVLFVDDEGALVDIVRDMLERFGYRVEAHKHPVEALDRFREAPDAFDLIITDLSMPFMTGDQLIRHVLAIRPAMPIVLCTGFHDDLSDDKARAMGLRAVLNKPVNLRDLIIGVRRALDNPT
ncbi:hypothetical protein JCM14469_28470 [Desulfatiferula olefinivorans]